MMTPALSQHEQQHNGNGDGEGFSPLYEENNHRQYMPLAQH